MNNDMSERLVLWNNLDTGLHFDNDELLAELDEVLNCMSSIDAQEFTALVLLNYSNERRIKIAVQAAKVLMSYLTARKMYNPYAPNKQCDTAIMGVLLHNVFYDRTIYVNHIGDWISVFTLRRNTEELAKEFTASNPQNYGMYDYVYQIVEAQLGEDMKPIGNRPVNGQITYIVWEVLWFYYSFLCQLPTASKIASRF